MHRGLKVQSLGGVIAGAGLWVSLAETLVGITKNGLGRLR